MKREEPEIFTGIRDVTTQFYVIFEMQTCALNGQSRLFRVT